MLRRERAPPRRAGPRVVTVLERALDRATGFLVRHAVRTLERSRLPFVVFVGVYDERGERVVIVESNVEPKLAREMVEARFGDAAR
jgi:hypothetical protein